MSKQKSYINLRLFVGLVLVLLAVIIFVLYQFLGLNFYLSAVSSIEELHSDYKKFAVDLFYGAQDNIYIYNGTLGFITKNKSGYPTIWIWGKNGLRYFKASDKTTYSNYRICLGDDWKTGNGTVKRNDNVSLQNWLANVKQGDFVGVVINDGKINNAFSYDWWIFKPYTKDELIQTCQKR